MRYRKFGKTGITISEIGHGTWAMGKRMWVGAEDPVSLRALHKAVDLGVNFIDTALVYGKGHAEHLVGRLLRERSERIYVATKIPPLNQRWPGQGSLQEAFPRHHIRESVQSSLQILGVERIDLIQLHVWNPDWLGESEWYDALCELKEADRVAWTGVSVNDHDPDSAVELVESEKVDSIQVIYNIFEQAPEDRLFPACIRHHAGVIARVPFDEGALTGSVGPQTRFARRDWRNFYFSGDRRQQVFKRLTPLRELLGEEARTLPELALKFCLSHPAISTIIPGMSRPDHVVANLKVEDTPPLSEELLGRLNSHRWDKNFYTRQA